MNYRLVKFQNYVCIDEMQLFLFIFLYLIKLQRQIYKYKYKHKYDLDCLATLLIEGLTSSIELESSNLSGLLYGGLLLYKVSPNKLNTV
jgi:hypothetical protein